MIFVDRSSVREPAILRKRGELEFEKAKKFYDRPIEERRQQRFRFKAYRAKEVKEALDKLFHGKCAYCESTFAHVTPMDVEQFRPKGGVISQDGTHYPDHYWWLANEWMNLYPVCIDCNRRRQHETPGEKAEVSGKGNRFPLEPGTPRASLLALFKASNRVIQYVGYSKERINQMRNMIRFLKWRSASGQAK